MRGGKLTKQNKTPKKLLKCYDFICEAPNDLYLEILNINKCTYLYRQALWDSLFLSFINL